MEPYLNIAQIVVSILLVTVILLQSRGAGLGGMFGGEGNVYSAKRGAERMLFVSTIVLSVLFLGLAFTGIFII